MCPTVSSHQHHGFPQTKGATALIQRRVRRCRQRGSFRPPGNTTTSWPRPAALAALCRIAHCVRIKSVLAAARPDPRSFLLPRGRRHCTTSLSTKREQSGKISTCLANPSPFFVLEPAG